MATTNSAAQPTAAPKLAAWVKTARPFTLTAAVSPVLVGTAVAARAGVFHPLPFLATLLSCLCLQIAANFFKIQFALYYR